MDEEREREKGNVGERGRESSKALISLAWGFPISNQNKGTL